MVVAPASMPEKAGSVFLSDETQERMGLALQFGRLISVSPVAFNYEPEWPPKEKPKVGDLVWFARYAGGEFKGRDGRDYRLIKDKDINGIIDETK